MGLPTFAPKITPFCGPIPKPSYLPNPWTHLTYLPKVHLYLIIRFATMHWTDRTDTQTNRWLKGMFNHNRPLSLYREHCGLIILANLASVANTKHI